MASKRTLTRDLAPVYKQRLQALHPELRPKWGSLSVPQMLAHVDELIRVSTGEVEARDESNSFLRTFLRPLIFSPVPFPRGKAKAPASLLPPPQGDLDAHKRQLIDHIDRFLDLVDGSPDGAW